MRSRWGGSARPRGRAWWLGVLAIGLASCAPGTPEFGAASRLRRAVEQGQATLLLRMVTADGEKPVRVAGHAPHVEVALHDMRSGRRIPFGGAAPSHEAHAAGWIAEPIPPGPYMLQVGPVRPGPLDRLLSTGEMVCDWVGVERFAITVPPNDAVYAGTLRLPCVVGGTDPPRAGRTVLAMETAAALPPLPGRSGAPRLLPAVPFDPAEARRGWPRPRAISVRADAVAWQAAIDWAGPTDHARSERTLELAGDLMPTGNWGIAGVVVAPFIAASVVTFMAAGVTAGAEAAANATEAAQRQRSFAACMARLGATVTPAATAAQVAPVVQPGTPGQVAWSVTLTRVVLRQCGEPMPIRIGTETATWWQAGERQAFFVRPVANARPAAGAASAGVAPWETETRPAAPCRPLQDYCAPGGEALVLRDAADAVLAARDALLVGQ